MLKTSSFKFLVALLGRPCEHNCFALRCLVSLRQSGVGPTYAPTAMPNAISTKPPVVMLTSAPSYAPSYAPAYSQPTAAIIPTAVPSYDGMYPTTVPTPAGPTPPGVPTAAPTYTAYSNPIPPSLHTPAPTPIGPTAPGGPTGAPTYAEPTPPSMPTAGSGYAEPTVPGEPTAHPTEASTHTHLQETVPTGSSSTAAATSPATT